MDPNPPVLTNAANAADIQVEMESTNVDRKGSSNSIEDLVAKIHNADSHAASSTALSDLIEVTRKESRREVVDSLIYIPRKHTSYHVRMKALNALRTVLETPVIDDDFVVQDVLPGLLEHFRSGTEDEKIHALGVLSLIAGKNSKLRNDILHTGVSQELVTMLKEGSMKMKLQVEKLMVDFSTDNPAAVVELTVAGAIPEFIGLLRKGTELNFEAGKFLGMLAQSTSSETTGLLDSAAVTEFLNDLKIGNERVRSSSGQILRKMARNCTPKQQQALMDAGVIPELLRLLGNDTAKPLRKDAMWLLPILCEVETFRDMVMGECCSLPMYSCG